MNEQTDYSLSSILKKRDPDSHKGNHGHVLIMAGNRGKMGAAVIAAKACLRSGVGLLTVSVPIEERMILQIAIPEAMLIFREHSINMNIFSAACIGPGLGINEETNNWVGEFILQFNQPLLIDADALNIIALNKSIEKIKTGTILTPHAVEFDRLFGTHTSHSERIETAIQISKKLYITIVLKGHHTLIASCGETYVNHTGNAGLAKGGSGDALSGIICSFLAQGYSAFEAAKLGVYLHGRASDIALNKQSMESMLITDVIDCLGDAFKELTNSANLSLNK